MEPWSKDWASWESGYFWWPKVNSWRFPWTKSTLTRTIWLWLCIQKMTVCYHLWWVIYKLSDSLQSLFTPITLLHSKLEFKDHGDLTSNQKFAELTKVLKPTEVRKMYILTNRVLPTKYLKYWPVWHFINSTGHSFLFSEIEHQGLINFFQMYTGDSEEYGLVMNEIGNKSYCFQTRSQTTMIDTEHLYIGNSK